MINKICADIIEEKNIRENLIQLNQMIRSEDNMDRFLGFWSGFERCCNFKRIPNTFARMKLKGIDGTVLAK